MIQRTPTPRFLPRLLRCNSGATAIEYGLIAALIFVVIITGVSVVGDNVSTPYEDVAAGFN